MNATVEAAAAVRAPADPVEEARRDGSRLYAEFAKQMETHRDRGLVDFKMKLFVEPETSSAGVIKTLTNVLRMLAEGKAKPLEY